MEPKLDQANVDDSFPDPHAHLTPLTAPTPSSSAATGGGTPTSSLLEVTPYSQSTAVTSFPLDLHPHPLPTSTQHQHPPHYYSDFEWQHGGVAGAGVPAAGDPAAHGSFYGFADRPDLASVQLYHTFPAGMPPHHTELYASSPALWTHAAPGLVVDDPSHAALTSQRSLPPMGRSSGGSSTTSPSSASGASTASSITSGKPKRRRVQSLTQRKAANVRERRRMFHLNTAFDELRKRLPAFNYEKRLSRIETLRLAMTYIGFMKDVTMGQDPRKVKLRPGNSSDAGSDLSHVDMESCTSEDAQHDDVDS